MTTLRFQPVTACFGATVAGIDLREEIGPDQARAVREALDRFHVLIFPSQAIDDAAHLSLARVLGEPRVHPFERAMGRVGTRTHP